MTMKQGLVILYTGKGKGKTTAALGLALRAWGHGFPVCVIQFIKGKRDTGEAEALRRMDGVDLHVTGHGFLLGRETPERDRAAARDAWRLAREIMTSSKHRLLILDEITHAVNRGLIDRDELIDCLEKREPGLHVVITGRDAPSPLVECADLVTEMREVKHPLRRGVKAQAGIEF